VLKKNKIIVSFVEYKCTKKIIFSSVMIAININVYYACKY